LLENVNFIEVRLQRNGSEPSISKTFDIVSEDKRVDYPSEITIQTNELVGFPFFQQNVK
jgi:hypothetical protein